MPRKSSRISAAVAKRSAAGRGARLDEEFREVRAEIGASRSRIGHHPAGHRHRIRIRMVAVAEQLVEQHADGEQVGGNVPAGKAGVGRLIGRRAGLRMHRVADAGGDIEVKQLRSAASENNVARFDVAVDQPSPVVPSTRPTRFSAGLLGTFGSSCLRRAASG